jgi:Cytotoxic translational repressor of toxin-antitoxin stability system
MNTIKYSRKAIRQLSKISESEKIVIACKALANMPECRNVTRLIKHQYGYRLRVGNYRVLFDFDGVVRIVSIEEVKKRDENTY